VQRGHEGPAEERARALVEAAQAGDAAAIAELVRAFDPILRGLAFHLLGDRELMDDVLQEAYLRAFRALPGFEGRSKVGTWLHRIVYNACVDELRRRGREAAVVPITEREVEQVASPDEDPGERLAQTSQLRTALAALGEAERATVWLVDAQGLAYGEAAEVLGVPEGTVASRLSRARASLRLAIAGEAGR
jgi:RNA polymerase sigma-70 factor (ECF subfamily)